MKHSVCYRIDIIEKDAEMEDFVVHVTPGNKTFWWIVNLSDLFQHFISISQLVSEDKPCFNDLSDSSAYICQYDQIWRSCIHSLSRCPAVDVAGTGLNEGRCSPIGVRTGTGCLSTRLWYEPVTEFKASFTVEVFSRYTRFSGANVSLMHSIKATFLS